MPRLFGGMAPPNSLEVWGHLGAISMTLVSNGDMEAMVQLAPNGFTTKRLKQVSGSVVHLIDTEIFFGET